MTTHRVPLPSHLHAGGAVGGWGMCVSDGRVVGAGGWESGSAGCSGAHKLWKYTLTSKARAQSIGLRSTRLQAVPNNRAGKPSLFTSGSE